MIFFSVKHLIPSGPYLLFIKIRSIAVARKFIINTHVKHSKSMSNTDEPLLLCPQDPMKNLHLELVNLILKDYEFVDTPDKLLRRRGLANI